MLRTWILMMAFTSATGCATLHNLVQPWSADSTPSHVQAEANLEQANLPVKKTAISPRYADLVAASEEEESDAEPNISTEEILHSALYQQYMEWRGTRYKLGGMSKKGIDCSAFVYFAFLDGLGVQLPRTTYEQVRQGKDVERSQLQTGDLVFFRTGRTNHVGIILEDDKFMHSSVRTGVRISSLNNVYWKPRYWKAKRLEIPSPIQLAQAH